MEVVAIITLNTVLNCIVPITVAPSDSAIRAIRVVCGKDAHVGCTVMYKYNASDGCRYTIYDTNGKCICDYQVTATNNKATAGGGFIIDASMSYIEFSVNAALSRTVDLTVEDFLSDVGSLDALYTKLSDYSVDARCIQGVVNVYLDCKSYDTDDDSITSFTTDDTLKYNKATGVLSVNTATDVEHDNTLPVTSAAVYTTVGNIEILLGLI